MKDLTFKAWKAAGFSVKKGEKAIGKNKDGEPTFARAQVEDSDDRFNFDGYQIKDKP